MNRHYQLLSTLSPPMLTEILPFQVALDTTAIAGASLWSLALYLSLASCKEWVMQLLMRWFNSAGRILYTSLEEFEKTRQEKFL